MESSVQEHASLGSSTCERVIKCPGSRLRAKASPTPPTSDAAMKGTAQHTIIEHLLLNGGDPFAYVDTEIMGVQIDADLATNVKVAFESSETLLKEYQGLQLVEHKLVMGPDVFGTGDLIGISADGKSALIADHKFGYVEVEPGSYQNRYLAALALYDEQPLDDGTTLKAQLDEVETFELAIIQPSFDPAHTSIKLPRETLEKFYETIKLADYASSKPNAQLQRGEHCGYCPAKLMCPAWKVNVTDLIDKAKHPDWDAAYIGQLLHLGGLYEDANERAKHELSHGRLIPGWRLGVGKTRQSWVEDDSTILSILRGQGLPEKVIAKPITPAQAKKAGATNLEEHIKVTTDAPPLKEISDPNEAPATPAAAFARAAEIAQGAPRSGRPSAKVK